MGEVKKRYKGCLAVVLLPVAAVLTFVLWGPDVSIPWVETRVVLPDNRGFFVYRQKGVHYAKVALQNGTRTEEQWLPYRPVNGPVAAYYYASGDLNCVRLQDQCRESLIDLQTAKTYLLIRAPSDQVFRGEILDCEDGADCSSINGGPWKVTVEGRSAEDFTRSGMATNSGLYIGRIEVLENREAPLGPPSVQFFPAAKEGRER